jgi:metal-responsive CopG/Arc/MetJ family transcriptional regulator
METIQVVIDAKLLQATDRAARKTKSNRSELVRIALREHLHRLQTLESEERDRRGYEKQPQEAGAEWKVEAAAWPLE